MSVMSDFALTASQGLNDAIGRITVDPWSVGDMKMCVMTDDSRPDGLSTTTCFLNAEDRARLIAALLPSTDLATRLRGWGANDQEDAAMYVDQAADLLREVVAALTV